MLRHFQLSGGTWLLAVFSIALTPVCALAQPQPQGQVPGRAQLRPAPMAPAVALTPELEQILLKWEQASAKTTKVKGELKRYEYDHTFKIVKAGNGKYWYEVPDKGRLDIEPVRDIPANAMMLAAGINFQVQPADQAVWVSNGAYIYAIDPTKKEYSEIKIPDELQGQNIGKGPLPFLFGMKAADIKTRYRLELGASHDITQRIHIVAHPLLESEQMEYSKAEVLISPSNYLPMAVQLAHGETSRTVYTFTKHDTVTMWLPTSNPFEINSNLLFKWQYRKIISEEQKPQQQAAENGILLK